MLLNENFIERIRRIMFGQFYTGNISEEIKPVKYKKRFNQKYNYVLCTKYGTSGITPTIKGCDCGCISSSGDSICGAYLLHQNIPNTDLCIVRCAEDIELRMK